MQPIFRILAAALGLTLALPALAGEGQARVERFFGDLKSMRAEFIQTLVDPRGDVLEESRGVLLLERPGRFRLEYRSPYEQLYVADGERLWMFDPDLEQVTVRPQGDALGSTPALLLSGTEPLEENFNVEELGFHEGFQWLELTPRERDATFERIRLALEEDMVRAMEMVDSFGQMTRLFFETVERNPQIADRNFTFTPPPGVDVIGEQE